MKPLRAVAVFSIGFVLAWAPVGAGRSAWIPLADPGNALEGASPRALVPADLDRDGAMDLAVGYGTPEGGAVAVYRGNLAAIFPGSPLPVVREAWRAAGQAPFLPGVEVHPLPSPAEMLAAGDLDGDGTTDLAAGARGDDALWLLAGGKDGTLGPGRRIPLPGALVALALGDLDRPDGAAGLAVAVERGGRTELLLYASPRGALLEPPETVSLPGGLTSLVVARVDGDAAGDVVATAAGGVWVVPGGSPSRAPRRLDLPVDVVGVAAGSFLGERREQRDLAIVTRSGEVRFVRADGTAAGAVEGRDLLVLDAEKRPLQVLGPLAATAALDAGAPPLALAAMRLNEDGVDDLVLVREGAAAPVVALSTSLATLTVNSTGDQPDAVPGNGVCATAAAVCTLRAAIQEANALAGADTIQFALGAGTPTITPTSALPAVTGTVAILGDTGGATRVQIAGTNAGAASGLVVNADSCVVRALVVNRFSFVGISIGGAQNRIENCWVGLDAAGGASVAGNGQGGIDLNALVTQSSNTVGGALPARNVVANNGGRNLRVTRSGNAVEGNFIGTDRTGTVDLGTSAGITLSSGTGTNRIGGSTVAPGRPPGNLIAGNTEGIRFTAMSDSLVQGNLIGTDVTGLVGLGNGTGVIVEQSSQSNLIGGATADLRNVISGNSGGGILFFGASNVGNAVEGNWIGVDLTGAVDLGNGNVGIDINNVPRQRIGGPTAVPGTPPGNVISGNSADGIVIRGSGASTNTVQGNLVGTDADGLIPIANAFDGIEVDDGASSTLIDGNVISGNGFAGILLHGASANLVTGNRIGTDPPGLSAIPNGSGVEIHESAMPAQFNVLGGSTPAMRNLISGNVGDGILVSGSTATGNRILGNFIGTDAGGLAALGNGGAGVRVAGDASGTRIGGLSGATPGACSGECNVVAWNGLAGVSVEGALSTGNPIRNGAIHDNVFLGINLDLFGVTPNDALDADAGANDLQNFPEIEGASFDGVNTTVTVRLRSAPTMTYEIDVYGNDDPDPTGHGEGKTYLGSASCATDGAGNCPLVSILVLGEPVWLSSTATGVAGQGTSEFSAAFVNPDEASPAQDLTASRGAGSTVDVVYEPACGASDHAIYWGQTPIASTLAWLASACALGTTGFASFDPGTPPPGRAFYFVVVGQHATREGSYGAASSGLARPEAIGIGACDLPLALTNTCP